MRDVRYIEARSGTFGTVYMVHGGPDHGRTLTVDTLGQMLDAGIPVVRSNGKAWGRLESSSMTTCPVG